MPYLKPPLVMRRYVNPLAMRFGIGGSHALTVAGRRTGRPQRVPLIPIEHAGQHYLVSPRGETDWVRNLRAAGRCRISGRIITGTFHAVEVAVDDRAEVIAAYRVVAGRAVRSFFAGLPHPADHPVFRLDPV